MIRPISPTVRPVLSEIGQLIQILTIHEQIERTMDDFNSQFRSAAYLYTCSLSRLAALCSRSCLMLMIDPTARDA